MLIFFMTLSRVNFSDIIRERINNSTDFSQNALIHIFNDYSYGYALLKLRYPIIAEEIEDALVHAPFKAIEILNSCSNFILDPLRNIRYDSLTHSFQEIKQARNILGNVDSEQTKFPCEIGRFLLNKLTYAPRGLRACNEMIDNYHSYDLQKVYSSLSEAIAVNDSAIMEKEVDAVSEILDNVWQDKSIPNKIKELKIGVPLSIAVIGEVASESISGIGGFLVGLGFIVGNELFKAQTNNLNEKIAKRFSRSYQANIYDFKKKYQSKITP